MSHVPSPLPRRRPREPPAKASGNHGFAIISDGVAATAPVAATRTTGGACASCSCCTFGWRNCTRNGPCT
eukprot:14395716-Alexandrium_andersonii.AAC.1